MTTPATLANVLFAKIILQTGDRVRKGIRPTKSATNIVIIISDSIIFTHNYYCSLHFISIYHSIILYFFAIRHLVSPPSQPHISTTTTAEVYLTRKLPYSCLTNLQYCHHQIFICRGEEFWMATFLLLCAFTHFLHEHAASHTHTNIHSKHKICLSAFPRSTFIRCRMVSVKVTHNVRHNHAKVICMIVSTTSCLNYCKVRGVSQSNTHNNMRTKGLLACTGLEWDEIGFVHLMHQWFSCYAWITQLFVCKLLSIFFFDITSNLVFLPTYLSAFSLYIKNISLQWLFDYP